MGAAIVAASMVPLARPPEEADKLRPLEIERLRQEQGQGAGETSASEVAIFDVTGHSLGIGIPDEHGALKFHRIIDKETVVPVSQTRGPFAVTGTLPRDSLSKSIRANKNRSKATPRSGDLHHRPRSAAPGQQFVEITFTLDASGILSTVCTDLRTKISYESSFRFDGIARMGKEEIEKKRQVVAGAMAYRPVALRPILPRPSRAGAAGPAALGPIALISDEELHVHGVSPAHGPTGEVVSTCRFCPPLGTPARRARFRAGPGTGSEYAKPGRSLAKELASIRI